MFFFFKIKIQTSMKRVKIGLKNENEMGDICLDPVRKRYLQKSIRSIWVLLRNCPFLEGFDNILRKYFFGIFCLLKH